MKRKKKTEPGDADIVNCEQLFSFQCPRQWKELAPTNEEGVRYCGSCEKNVFYCQSLPEAEKLAGQGKCVALDNYYESMVVGGMIGPDGQK